MIWLKIRDFAMVLSVTSLLEDWNLFGVSVSSQYIWLDLCQV